MRCKRFLLIGIKFNLFYRNFELHGNSRTQDIIIQSLPCIAWLTLELVLYPLFYNLRQK